MVGEAAVCGVRNSRGNTQETNVKNMALGVSQSHITSSTGDTSFCSMTVPGYRHCQSFAAVEVGRWRMFLLTARP